jgi:nitrite reductase/ring-hydroxylating ferredoxin subunit
MADMAKRAKPQANEELSKPMTIVVDAYISEDYARAERDRLWRKVWQQVGRVEELPEVGSYLTYDILDDSIIVVRTGEREFHAHHNVCMHRGRRLIDTPEGAKNACARTRKSFVCGFHGWTYGLDGTCTHIREQQDWQDALTPDNTHLPRCEDSGPVRPGEHALQVAQVAVVRLQLEGRNGGLQRDLPRLHHPSGVQ